jgi:hypothetical protein
LKNERGSIVGAVRVVLHQEERFGGQTNTVAVSRKRHSICTYSQSVWRALGNWIGVNIGAPPSLDFDRLKAWWRSSLQEGNPDKAETTARLQKMIYACWNIWKERCRRLYDNKALPASALQQAIKFDVHQWLIAWDQVPRLRFIACFHSRVRANQVKLAMDRIPSSFTGKHISYLKTLILSCVGLFLVLSLHNGIELLRQL